MTDFMPTSLRLSRAVSLARSVRKRADELACREVRAPHIDSVESGLQLVFVGCCRVAMALCVPPPDDAHLHGITDADEQLSAIHSELELVRRDAGDDETAREGLSIAWHGLWALRMGLSGHRVEPDAIALNH